jgi:hypothetical protein
MVHSRQVKLNLDPFYKAIIQKNPIDLLAAFDNAEKLAILDVSNNDDLKAEVQNSQFVKSAILFNNPTTDQKIKKSCLNDAECLKLYNYSQNLLKINGSRTTKNLEDPAVVLTILATVTELTEETLKDDSKVLLWFKNVLKKTELISVTIVETFKRYLNLLYEYYINNKNDLDKGRILFKLKLLCYGVNVTYIEENFLQNTRNVYLVLLPTYLAMYFDDYNRPEVLGSQYQDIIFTDARTTLQQKIEKNIDIVPPNTKMLERTYLITNTLLNYFLTIDDLQLEKFKKLYACNYKLCANNEQIKNDFSTIDPTIFDKLREDPVQDQTFPKDIEYDLLMYYAYPGPTGMFVATTAKYTVKSAELENGIYTIVRKIVEAMSEPDMSRLPQYDNPKIKQSNKMIMQEFQELYPSGYSMDLVDSNNMELYVNALWCVPNPTPTVDFKFENYSSKQNIKVSTKSEEIVSSDVIEAQNCIYGKTCKNDQYLHIIGPLISSVKPIPKNSEAQEIINNMCSSSNPDLLKKLKDDLKLPDIEGETDKNLCSRIKSKLQEKIDRK